MTDTPRIPESLVQWQLENDCVTCSNCGTPYDEQVEPLAKNELPIVMATAADLERDSGHRLADVALLRFISDPEITEAYLKIDKWYS